MFQLLAEDAALRIRFDTSKTRLRDPTAYPHDTHALRSYPRARYRRSLLRGPGFAGTFAFEGRPVGYFEHTTPSEPGRHRFMPYRGQGHVRLIGELENNRIARCSLPDGTFLVVLAIPEPGVIELGDVGHAKDLVRTDR